MMPLLRTYLVTLACSLCATLAACSESATQSEQSAQTSWLLTSAPADPLGVLEAKNQVSEGDTIHIKGIIGGRVDAMSTESAIFVIIDDQIENPCVGDDDHCATPWDFCCTTPEVLMQNSATIQLVDADGHTIPGDLRDYGIEPLDTVQVIGTVGPRSSSDVLTIKASGIYKSQGG